MSNLLPVSGQIPWSDPSSSTPQCHSARQQTTITSGHLMGKTIHVKLSANSELSFRLRSRDLWQHRIQDWKTPPTSVFSCWLINKKVLWEYVILPLPLSFPPFSHHTIIRDWINHPVLSDARYTGYIRKSDVVYYFQVCRTEMKSGHKIDGGWTRITWSVRN